MTHDRTANSGMDLSALGREIALTSLSGSPIS